MNILNISGKPLPVQFSDGTKDVLPNQCTIESEDHRPIAVQLPSGDYVIDHFPENYPVRAYERKKKFHWTSFVYGALFAEIVVAILLKVGILYLG